MPPRFSLRALPGSPPRVAKRGPAEPLAREAAALAMLAGRPWAPALLAHRPGLLVSRLLPGLPRRLAQAPEPDLRRLGAVLAEVHAARAADEGGLPWWPAPVATLAAYRERRAQDTATALAGRPEARLVEPALARASTDGGGRERFRLLHGDLVEANVLWTPAGPALVDWEFWRMGDPAEDLAYLIELNGVGPSAAEALLDGYAAPDMGSRADGWRALVALDAAAWYLAEGMEAPALPLLARAHRLVGRPRLRPSGPPAV